MWQTVPSWIEQDVLFALLNDERGTNCSDSLNDILDFCSLLLFGSFPFEFNVEKSLDRSDIRYGTNSRAVQPAALPFISINLTAKLIAMESKDGNDLCVTNAHHITSTDDHRDWASFPRDEKLIEKGRA